MLFIVSCSFPTSTLLNILPLVRLLQAIIIDDAIISRRAETVEPGRIIRPLGITEIGRAGGESVGFHRRPDGIDYVCASFHHDDQPVEAGDSEPKLIRPHAEAGIAGLALRVPQHGRTTAKRWPPARGPGQVIDGHIIVTVERSRPNAWGVTFEIDSRQAVAVRERIPPNAGDAVGDRDAGQAGAGIERIAPDAGDAVGDRDAGQAAAVLERIGPDDGDAIADCDAAKAAVLKRPVPDAGDAVGHCVATGFAIRTLDERGLALVEQHPIHTAIDGI